MAFKMTPGMKGNPAAKRVAGLGACGGPGLPPCPPRFQQEVTEAKVQDQKRNRFVKAKVAKKVVASPPPKPPAPPKLQINLPKGYEFGSKMEESRFYEKIQGAIDMGSFESQEQLDIAIMKQLKGGKPKDPKEDSPFDPKDPFTPFDPKKEVPKEEGPIMVDPKKPVVVASIKGNVGKAKSVAAK